MKPWEETWRMVKLPSPAEEEWEVESDHVSMLEMADEAHVRLQFAAPDMARVLRRLSGVEDQAPCVWCADLQHHADCPIVAALRKAGVR